MTLVGPQVSCQQWSQVLLQNKEWDAVLEHTLMAWRYVSELPQWDTANHNALREQCYSLLAANCLGALQHYQPAASRGRQLLRRYVSKGLGLSEPTERSRRSRGGSERDLARRSYV